MTEPATAPTSRKLAPGILARRLDPDRLAANFADVCPPLDAHEARVAADRCYFCYDAPCVHACPTAIDIPLFIRQIQGGRPVEAARTIWDQNIFGAACARVCPTEQLCEGACVRQEAEGKPVEIGRLQRHATDAGMATNSHPYVRAPLSGRRVAVVGGGAGGPRLRAPARHEGPRRRCVREAGAARRPQ